jgi:hypothetical protein
LKASPAVFFQVLGNEAMPFQGGKSMKKILLGTLLILLCPAFATAGVVLTDISGDKTYISDGRLKYESKEGQTQIFLTQKEEIILIDNERQVYARGTVDDFCRLGKDLMESAMAGMSPQEREMMKQFMAGSQSAPKAEPAVSVSRQGSGGKIAGLDTEKYRVNVDGEPYAELWLSKDRALMQELGGLQKLLALAAEMGACMEAGTGMSISVDPENTPEYQALYREGYPLKVVSLQGTAPEVDEEVAQVEEKSLSDEEFQAPAGYRSLSFSDFIGGGFF